MELCDSLGLGLMCYTIPMPDDSPIPGRNAEEMVVWAVKNGLLDDVEPGN